MINKFWKIFLRVFVSLEWLISVILYGVVSEVQQRILPETLNFQGAQESIPLAYVAWWAGTKTLFQPGS
jgi:hypothetical protein